MVAASLGAAVTVIERAGLGGSAVLTDVVPSKTLIATADLMTRSGVVRSPFHLRQMRVHARKPRKT